MPNLHNRHIQYQSRKQLQTSPKQAPERDQLPWQMNGGHIGVENDSGALSSDSLDQLVQYAATSNAGKWKGSSYFTRLHGV